MTDRQAADTAQAAARKTGHARRSPAAAFVETYLRMKKDRRTEKQTVADLAALRAAPEPHYTLPDRIRLEADVTCRQDNGLKTYLLQPHSTKAEQFGRSDEGKAAAYGKPQQPTGAVEAQADTAPPIILYIHGGAYIHEITKHHWAMLDEVVQLSGAHACVPIYPLAPWHTWRLSYDLVTHVYQCIVPKHGERKVILMGDSAGGGMALGLAQHFARRGLRQPDALVLLSPWVDATMGNPAAASLERVDPMLGVGWLRGAAHSWAGGTRLEDWRLSPLFGTMEGLPPTTVFTGTREIFYPDCVLLHERLQAAGVASRLIVGKNMNHVYPVYPIPEAHEARQTIAQTLLDT